MKLVPRVPWHDPGTSAMALQEPICSELDEKDESQALIKRERGEFNQQWMHKSNCFGPFCEIFLIEYWWIDVYTDVTSIKQHYDTW